MNDSPAQSELAHQRNRMVDRQIIARGIRDEDVLKAMREIPREEFVPPEHVDLAYKDRPLPIAEGQTISQPFMVAMMTEAAEIGPGDRVLEVGTGSGYAAAVFSRIAARVFTVERHHNLAEIAEERLHRLGYDNVEVAVRDGTLGWEEHAPFDAIIVAAGSPEEAPQPLKDQLAPGGRLIIPVGSTLNGQELVRIRRSADGETLSREHLGAVRFVPLVGREAWTEGGGRGT